MIVSPQRGTMRRRYEDDGISDDEIEGKRTFDLEEKLHTNKYNANFVTFMEGKGQYHLGSELQLLDVGSCGPWKLWAQHLCSQNIACRCCDAIYLYFLLLYIATHSPPPLTLNSPTLILCHIKSSRCSLGQ